MITWAKPRARAASVPGLGASHPSALDENYLDLENKSNGPAFCRVTSRLRREYYDRWVVDPLRVDPMTAMIRFTENGVTTKLRTVFNGDAPRQFDAIWHYFRSIEKPDGEVE